ncbi:MAG: hypothetical protein JWR21_1117 [Herminiimonas sp.]|nr:hypothetical protein [Herminiimonas sp.]
MRFLGLTLGDWRRHSTASSGLLDTVGEAGGIVLLSARTCGLKGLVPGGRHSWLSVCHNGRWSTVEISDAETLSYQHAVAGGPARWRHFGAPGTPSRCPAPFISDRTPDGLWFGQVPRLEWHCADPQRGTAFYQHLDALCKTYRFRHVFSLADNNCSKFVSYLLWHAGLVDRVTAQPWKSPLLGFRRAPYWESLYPGQSASTSCAVGATL